MGTKASFPASFDRHCRVLILGSLPGEMSLTARQYYANPANQFWRLAGTLISRDLVAQTYPARLEALIEAGIGLWDVIRSAHRTGSLDGAIRDHDENDLGAFVGQLPNLKCVAFNGGKASAIGRRQIHASPVFEMRTLPSSSPAYCAITLEQKKAEWLKLRPHLLGVTS